MAMGVMSGTGTQDDPFIIEDGLDFNALRNISNNFSSLPSGLEDFQYVELANDISLSMFPMFTALPRRAYNIDGKGHMISNINLIAPPPNQWGERFGSTGLFQALHVSDYIKDLKLEGTIDTMVQMDGMGGNVGTLTQELALHHSAVISNVEAYFEIKVEIVDNAISVGGIAGLCSIRTSSNQVRVTECGFKGKITVDSSPRQPWDTLNNRMGGIFGALVNWETWNGSAAFLQSLTIERCHVEMSIELDPRWGGQNNIGGIYAATWTNRGNISPLSINDCVAKIDFRFIHTTSLAANTIVRIGGIVMNPATSTNSNVTLNRCVAFIDVLWVHTIAVPNFQMAGLLFHGHNAGQNFTINQGYAVMKMINPNNRPWAGIGANFGSITLLPSTTPNVIVNDAFFDIDVFEEGFDGAFTITHGVSTAQLKNQSFLEGQGWVFES